MVIFTEEAWPVLQIFLADPPGKYGPPQPPGIRTIVTKDGKLETIINDFGRGYSPASTPGMAPGVSPPSITIHHDDSGEQRKPGPVRLVQTFPFFQNCVDSAKKALLSSYIWVCVLNCILICLGPSKTPDVS